MKKIIENNRGIATLSVVVLIATVLVIAGVSAIFPNSEFSALHTADAGTATTAVTVLNTAPDWATGGDAEESAESSTTTPTNAGSNVSWVGTASDPNAESYYLLICKDDTAPTARSSQSPICNGAGQWAVSGLTASDVQATATRASQASDGESNNWYAFICDGNAFNPKCNTTYKQGSGSTASPFIVNHRPTFTVYADDSPKDPGATVTWTTTAADTDTVGGADQVKLFVCKTAGFNGTSCTGETYATSSLTASDPSAQFTLESIKQDGNYTAYGYVVDNHDFQASGGSQGTDSTLTVANVAPTVTAGTIQLLDTDEAGDMQLTTGQGQTTGFKVKYTVLDNNSCQIMGGGNELATASINVYRSANSGLCRASGDHDPNDCYAAAIGTGTWNFSCSQDGGTCGGSGDDSATWTCTFPMWFVADPTVGSSVTDSTYWNQNWLTEVRTADDDGGTSAWTETTAGGNEVGWFLDYVLNTASINYGGLEPGTGNATLSQTTEIFSTGNVGMDETLYGDDMCPGYPACGGQPTNTIFKDWQHYGISALDFGDGASLSADPGVEFELNALKSTNTGAPVSKNTYWGIFVPGTITLAGDYTGLNTIVGKRGEAENWQ